MKILAMDSAAASCSVALWQDDQVIAHSLKEMTRGHASELLPLIETLLQDQNLSVDDLDGFAVTVGPGAFTGLRIGLACARGFGVASKKPVIGVTTLEALNKGISDRSAPVLCALDAKRSDLYGQAFNVDGSPLSDPVARLPEDIVDLLHGKSGPVLIAGDSFSRLEAPLKAQGFEPIESEIRLPEARFVAEIAAHKIRTRQDLTRPSAFYIRPPDADLPKNGGRLRP